MIDFNALPLPQLFGELTNDGSLGRLLDACRAEDLGHAGDVTTASIIDPETRSTAQLIAREPGVVAGLAAVPQILLAFEADVTWTARTRDGERCIEGEALGTLEGALAHVLTLERTMLNIIARLCGVATLTRRYVEAAKGTSARICDTRKTSPAMRSLEKYAVRCGGGWLHRMGLFDAALYKDNHVAGIDEGELAERLEAAIGSASAKHALRFVEVEVDSIAQLRAVLTLPAGLVDMVLLDNMSPTSLREAVALRATTKSKMLLEASGGVTLETVRIVAETGVDRISVGALTHAAPALDLALEVAS